MKSPVFGSILQQNRELAGISQEDVAAAVGVALSVVRALERMDTPPINEFLVSQYALAISNNDPYAGRAIEWSYLSVRGIACGGRGGVDA